MADEDEQTEQMAKMTRKQAKDDDESDRTPVGSHGFEGSGEASGGAAQTSDLDGDAPASSMAQQHANPAQR